MKHLSRVVWQEGMYLGPHHFQAQSRYYEETIGFSVFAAAPWAFGLIACEFDAKAVRNGTLRLVSARGVLPDGTPFDMPDADEPPETLSLNAVYEPDGRGMEVCLALPVRRSGGNFSTANGDGPVRFRTVAVRLPDETLGRGEAEVEIGRKNFALLTPAQAAEHDGAYGPRWSWLPVARVVRDASGAFVLDPEFVPAALQVRASTRLLEIAEALVRKLTERAASVAREHARRGGQWGLSAREVMQFWFLHTLNGGIAGLTHLLAQNCHPSELFLEMSRIAGGLCTFATEASPAKLPAYDAMRPGSAIAALDSDIRRYLEVAFPTGCLRIALTPLSKGYWQGPLEDARLTGKAAWILGIRSSARADQILATVPEVIKICSGRWVARLVERQLPGLALRHLTVPPAGCSPSREFHYFSVDRSGPCWGDISGTRTVGIYVPDSLPEAEVELMALPE
jgi:type VI secretion system protein ImpJ